VPTQNDGIWCNRGEPRGNLHGLLLSGCIRDVNIQAKLFLFFHTSTASLKRAPTAVGYCLTDLVPFPSAVPLFSALNQRCFSDVEGERDRSASDALRCDV
jgi:hypothetical protein